MAEKKSKNARTRGGSNQTKKRKPATPTKEKPATPLEQAESYIRLATSGACEKPAANNPFVASSGLDTLHYVHCGLELFSQLSLMDAGIGMDKDLEFGQFLILKCMTEALRAAEEQLRNDDQLARARATVDALRGVQS